MTDRTYNGWSTYETWLVNLWLSNDEWTEAQAHTTVRQEGAEGLKSFVDELAEQSLKTPTGMINDLVYAALSEVNWHEIAEHYTDDDDNSEDNEGDAE